jgi:hypothetical protein
MPPRRVGSRDRSSLRGGTGTRIGARRLCLPTGRRSYHGAPWTHLGSPPRLTPACTGGPSSAGTSSPSRCAAARGFVRLPRRSDVEPFASVALPHDTMLATTRRASAGAKRLLPRWFVGVHATSGIRRTGDWRHVSTSTRNRRSSCESGPLTRIATENCKRKRYCGFVFYSLRQLVRLCSDFGAEFRAVPPNLIALMARQSPLLGSIRYLSPVARFR